MMYQIPTTSKLVLSANTTAIGSAPNRPNPDNHQAKTSCRWAFFSSRFQVAWAAAEASTRARANAVVESCMA